jgi:hypothetical protein
MKSILIAAVLLMTAPSISQKGQDDLDLPELHKVQKISLGPSYSCRSKEDFQKGYGNTGLFLSKSSHSPDLLFNGACGSRDYLEGGEMTVIADLGKLRLEDLKADQALNVQRVHSQDLYSRFTSEVEPEIGHVYAVLINKIEARGLFYFTVTGYIPNERLDLRYSVKQYQLMGLRAQSPGFDWERRSQ